MTTNSKPGLASRLGRATLRRIGLHHDHPSFGFRTTRVFGRGLWSTLDIRQRPSLGESFGPVDGDGGRDLFAEHCSKVGLTDTDLDDLARRYRRNAHLFGCLALGSLAGGLLALVNGLPNLSFSLLLFTPILVLIGFRNRLHSEQVRARRYMGGLEFLGNLW